MSEERPVKIILVEDDMGHAKLIEKNLRHFLSIVKVPAEVR